MSTLDRVAVMTTAADSDPWQTPMIKQINTFILSRILGIRLRSVAAVFLGGCAGLSLTTTVLPTGIETMGVNDSFSARLDLAGFAIYSIMLWGVGGWAAWKTASTWGGGITLGLVGLVSAAIFTGMTYGAGVNFLLLGGVTGMLYGMFGGMLIASALAEGKTPTSE
jgi:hypothetical protein